MTTSDRVKESTAGGLARPRGKSIRWGIAILLGVGVLINYVDRSNLSVAEGPLSAELGLSPGQMGVLLSSFGWSHLVFQIPMGALLDRIGVTWLQRIATIVWITIALGGLAAVSPICWAIPSLIAPHGTVGTVSAIMNCIGQIGAVAAPLITGFTVGSSGSFAPAFIAAGVVLALGIVSFAAVLGKIEPISVPAGNPAPEPAGGGSW